MDTSTTKLEDISFVFTKSTQRRHAETPRKKKKRANRKQTKHTLKLPKLILSKNTKQKNLNVPNSTIVTPSPESRTKLNLLVSKKIKPVVIKRTYFSKEDCTQLLSDLESKHAYDYIILDLSNTYVTNSCIELLSKNSLLLNRLVGLRLKHCCLLTRKSLVHISQFKRLKILSATNIGLKDTDTKLLVDLKNLTRLDLSFNNLTNKSFENVSTLTKLKTLILNHNQYTNDNDELKGLTLLQNLRNLDLSYNPLKDTISDIIIKLKDLKNLSLASTDITNVGARHICYACRDLKSLDFSGCEINNQTLEYIGSYLKALDKLSIRDCQNITIIDALIHRNIPTLKQLDIHNCQSMPQKYIEQKKQFLRVKNYRTKIYNDSL